MKRNCQAASPNPASSEYRLIRMILYRLIIPVCCILILSGAFPGLSSGEEDEKALTLMVYMAGSDLETQNGAASADIREMLASGCDFDRVNLIILAGGAENWQLGLRSDELSVLQLGSRGMRIIQHLPLANMGAPETLTSFLNYSKEAFPARDYALIFWNHGGGPMEGVCYDELFGRDRLTLAELEEALAAGPFGPDNRLNWIGFDACMMASVETAYTCTDYARYMIASQETEPAAGWNYSFLARAAENPDGAALGQSIVNAYMSANSGNDMLTLSCVELDRIGPVLRGVSDLFYALRDVLNAETFSALSNDRRDTKSFGRTTTLSDYDLADLYHFSECCAPQAPEEAAALQTALEKAVIYNSSRQENAHGLSIYSPYYNKSSYSDSWLDMLEKLGISSGYISWIRRYASYWLADQLADWSGLAGSALPVGKDGIQAMELHLTEEQQKHFASARVIILRDQGYDHSYFQVYEIPDLTPENGILRAEYDYSGLYLLDENGKIISDIYPFQRLADGQYSLVAELEKTSMFHGMVQKARDILQAADETKLVNLICTLNPETDSLEVRNVIAHPEDPNELTTGKQYVTISASDYPFLFFSANRYAFFPTRSEDTGRLLPYTQWNSSGIPLQNWTMIDSDGNTVTASEWLRSFHEQTVDDQNWLFFSEADNSRPWSLQFLKGQDSPQRFYAQFIVTDTQGVENATELIPLHFPALRDSREFSRELYRDERAAITLNSIDVVQAASGSGLYLRFLIENNTDRKLNFLTANLSLNETAIDNTNIILPNAVEPHSVMEEQVTILTEDIPYLAERLTKVGFTAALWEAGNAGRSTIAADPVILETDLDVSALGIPQPAGGTVWAEDTTASGAFTIRLMDLEEKKDGSVQGLLHLLSRSSRSMNVTFFVGNEDAFGDAIVNGCFLRDVLHASAAGVVLPSGYDLYVPFTLNRTMQLETVGSITNSAEDPFSSGDGFDYWGITRLDSLAVPLVVNDDFYRPEFILSSPFRLSFRSGNSPAGPDSRALLKDSPVYLAFRAMNVAADGSLRLEADIRSESESTLCFRVADASVDGKYADALLVSETYVSDYLFTPGWITVNKSEGLHRMLISLKPEEESQFRNVSDVSLVFEIAEYPGFALYQDELDWERFEEVRISSSDIIQGGMLPEINLAEALGGRPAVPENPDQYSHPLRLPLSSDQIQRLQSAMVSLVLPCGTPGKPDDCFRLANLTRLRLEGSELIADFNGLLAEAKGNQMPFFQYIYPEQEKWHYLAAWLDLQNSGADSVLLAEHIHLVLSPDGASAFTRQYFDTGDLSQLRESAAVLSDYLEVYQIPGVTQGSPPHYDQWTYLGMSDDTVSLDHTEPSLAFRPASDWNNLYVVFSITDTDGSQWAVSMPYQ